MFSSTALGRQLELVSGYRVLHPDECDAARGGEDSELKGIVLVPASRINRLRYAVKAQGERTGDAKRDSTDGWFGSYRGHGDPGGGTNWHLLRNSEDLKERSRPPVMLDVSVRLADLEKRIEQLEKKGWHENAKAYRKELEKLRASKVGSHSGGEP